MESGTPTITAFVRAAQGIVSGATRETELVSVARAILHIAAAAAMTDVDRFLSEYDVDEMLVLGAYTVFTGVYGGMTFEQFVDAVTTRGINVVKGPPHMGGLDVFSAGLGWNPADDDFNPLDDDGAVLTNIAALRMSPQEAVRNIAALRTRNGDAVLTFANGHASQHTLQAAIDVLTPYADSGSYMPLLIASHVVRVNLVTSRATVWPAQEALTFARGAIPAAERAHVCGWINLARRDSTGVTADQVYQAYENTCTVVLCAENFAECMEMMGYRRGRVGIATQYWLMR